MLFHTYTFAIFFAIVYTGFLVLRKTRFWIHWLLAASYFFYGWWNPFYLLLILYSTTIDYVSVRLMESDPRRKKLWFALGVTSVLFLLLFYKYSGFMIENLNFLIAAAGIRGSIPKPGFALPVGISFFTFQSLSYIIDCYRGELAPEKNFIRYAAFVSLFPQLVAGPIQRASHLLPQMQSQRTVSLVNVTDGLSLFVVGLVKKVAFADFLAMYVNKVYASPGDFDSLALLMATYAFAWQVYFDFSGYTDMARGVARMMGIDLSVNFNHPYLATSLRDFWRRWHISLSTWFRDYVYIPLGGSRRGTANTYKNMFLTFVISGVWHGAAWTFFIWGALHGLGRLLTAELEKSSFYNRIPDLVKQFWVFNFVALCWIFFRAATLSDAWTILTGIARCRLVDPGFPLAALVFIAAVWAYQYLSESRMKTVFQFTPVRVGLVASMLLYVAFCVRSSGAAFIYFQF